MLTEERLSKIVSIVNASGSVTVAELMNALGASESTIRRDLLTLDDQQRLVKVRGGAIARGDVYRTRDDEVVLRKGRNTAEKLLIAEYAGELILDDDVVFIDAGTTTEMLIPHIKSKRTTFVTNALSHAMKLAEMGLTVYILGGEFKNTTEAIVGEEAILSLAKFNFTKGFFGVNGITEEQGYSTPEIRESMVKRYAMEKCGKSYVLADHSKFGFVSAITFGDFKSATVITDQIPAVFRSYKNIMEVKQS